MKAIEMHYLSDLFHQIYQINVRNSASRWFSLSEYITMHGPLNVKFKLGNIRISGVFALTIVEYCQRSLNAVTAFFCFSVVVMYMFR